MYIYTHILHSIETLVGQKMHKKIGIAVNVACQEYISARHRFVSLVPIVRFVNNI